MFNCHDTCKICERENDETACKACHDGEFKYSINFTSTQFRCVKNCKLQNRYAYEKSYHYCKPDENEPSNKVLKMKSRAVKNITQSTIYSTKGYSFTGVFYKSQETTKIPVPAAQKSLSTSKELLSTPNAIVLIAALILLAIFFVIALLINRKKRQIQIQKKLKINNCKNRECHPLVIKINTQKTNNSFNLQKLDIVDLSRFSYTNPIGNGAFSNVYKGTLDGNEVAVKVANTHKGRKCIHTELKIFDKTSHPNILPALGVHFGLSNILFMPLRKYNLKNFLKKFVNKIEVKQLTWYCIQVADGMKYLHGKKILHCDLKAENLLVKENDGKNIEISDFGCAVDLSTEPAPSYRGTKTHCSYEVLQAFVNPERDGKCSNASDVWSYAVTTWEIYSKTEDLPNDFKCPKDIIENYEKGKHLNQPTLMPDYLWRYIILQCFDLIPLSRPSMDQLHRKFLDFQQEPIDSSI